MTREFLKKLGVADEHIDAIMAENGKDIESAKGSLATTEQQLGALKTENDGLKAQLSDRDKDINALKKQAGDNTDLAQKLSDLQTKYDADTKTLTEQLADQAYTHAAERYFDTFKFSSNAAKKAALADFKAKKLKLADGKFEGADEFMAALKKDDPSAFAAEDKPTGQEGQQGQPAGKPQFTTGGTAGGAQGAGGAKSPFDFGFTAVRTPKTTT